MTYKILKITIIKNLPFGGSPVVCAIYPDNTTNDIEEYRKSVKAEHGADRVFLAYCELNDMKVINQSND